MKYVIGVLGWPIEMMNIDPLWLISQYIVFHMADYYA